MKKRVILLLSRRRLRWTRSAKNILWAELSKKHGVHANQISQWKHTAVENMEIAFTRGKVVSEQVSSSEIEKLHSKIVQLNTLKDFPILR